MNKDILQKPPRKYDMFFNTVLTPDQEKIYQQWVNSLPINLRGDYDYDLRGAWLNGDKPDQYHHMPDTWKKPWHPTFSNESVYSTPGAEGGRWDGEEFHPSRLNRTLQSFKFGEWGDNTFAKGGKIPDWDPENPYHIHTEDGKKVVYSKEAYDALPDYLKQQVDEHYNEMNTFDNQYERVENPEYQMFMQRLKNSNAAINVVASKNGYWDQNWLDAKYKSGEYMFDDNGLLYYNGQTYAPWGSGNNAIVVPMRTPNGMSYGANVAYYPTTVPESTTITTKKPLPATTEVNSSIPIKNAIQKKQSEYIKANTKYYTPYYMDWNYDPITDSLISPSQYERKYSYSGVPKMDSKSNTALKGDENGLPYLSEEQFMRGVRKIVSKYNNMFYDDIEDGYRDRWTVWHYINQYPDEYRNRKQPSADEVERNAVITTDDILNELSYGGSIHIKPENRGKFTAAAKRVGKSVQEYASQILANKDHYSSTLVKRANFAHVFGKK